MRILSLLLVMSIIALTTACIQVETSDEESEATTMKDNGLNEDGKYPTTKGPEPTEPEATEKYEPVPPKVAPGDAFSAPPSDAVILFDGTSLDGWEPAGEGSEAQWALNDDGSMTVVPGTGDHQTKETFGSCQLHIEWKIPADIEGEGQDRGNSGVFLQGLYEVQILDNHENTTYVNGQAGSIYKQHIPLVNACKPAGEWQSYDIVFRAPKFNEEGERTRAGRFTVFHNGVLIQDHVKIHGTGEYIGWPRNEAHGDGPLKLQDHDHAVSFRNIWYRPL